MFIGRFEGVRFALGLVVVGSLVVAGAPRASAETSTLYAYAPGLAPAAGAPAACPQVADAASGCSLAAALEGARAGDTIELATPGSVEPYVGNWDLDLPWSSPMRPLTIEGAPGVSGPILDGNGGSSSGCTTESCAGPVLRLGRRVSATIEGVTIQNGDSAERDAGGIDTGDGTAGGVLTILDSTFVGDRAGVDGGAIDNADHGGWGVVSITDSTFVGDDTGAAGAAVDNSGSLISAANIFAGSCAQSGGRWQDLGYNVAIDSSCLGGMAAGDTTDPSLDGQLSPVGALGGPTMTVAPTTGNPALGLVPAGTSVPFDGSALSLCPRTGERGVASAAGESCDSGALELAADTTALTVEPSPGATAAPTSGDSTDGSGTTAASTAGPGGSAGSTSSGSATDGGSATGGSGATTGSATSGSGGTSTTAVGGTLAFHVSVDPAPTVPAGFPAPTGTVTVSDGQGTLCTIDLASTDTCSASDLAPGTYDVTATYNSTDGYLASTETASGTVSAVTTVAVAVPDQTLTFSPAAQPAVLSATVTSPEGVVNTGMVQFSVLQGAMAVGSGATAPVVHGTATATYSLPPATSTGTYAVAAAYASAGHLTARSGKSTLIVTKARQVISFVHPRTTAVVGQHETVVAVSSAHLPVLLDVPATSSGVCRIDHGVVSFVRAGRCTIDARQAGNGEYEAAPAAALTVTVTPPHASAVHRPPRTRHAPTTQTGQRPTISSVPAASLTVGHASQVAVDVGGLPLPTLRAAGRLPAGVRLSQSGTGSAAIDGTPEYGSAGTYRIRLIATNAAGAATRGLTLRVGKAASSLRVIGPADADAGQLVNLEVIVAGGAPRSGTVRFLDGTLPLGEVALGPRGSASFSTAALPLGTDAVTARYAGNGALAAAAGSLRVRILSAQVLAAGSSALAGGPPVTAVPFTDRNLLHAFWPASLVLAGGLGLMTVVLLRRRRRSG